MFNSSPENQIKGTYVPPYNIQFSVKTNWDINYKLRLIQLPSEQASNDTLGKDITNKFTFLRRFWLKKDIIATNSPKNYTFKLWA